MKKLFIILALAAILASCQKEENQVVPPPDPIKTTTACLSDFIEFNDIIIINLI